MSVATTNLILRIASGVALCSLAYFAVELPGLARRVKSTTLERMSRVAYFGMLAGAIAFTGWFS